jgi:esterase/lipase
MFKDLRKMTENITKEQYDALKKQLEQQTKINADLSQRITAKNKHSYIKKLMTMNSDDKKSTSETHISLNTELCEVVEDLYNEDNEEIKKYVKEITDEVVFISVEFKEVCRQILIDFFKAMKKTE